MIPTTGHSGKDKTTETVKRSVVSRAQGDGRRDEWVEHGIFRAAKPFCVLLSWPIHVTMSNRPTGQHSEL